MNIAIISLRYAPGNWQHMMSFYLRLKNREIKINFILADEFKLFVENEQLDCKIYYSGYSKRFIAIFSYFLNLFSFISLAKKIALNCEKTLFVIWHPLNFYFMFLLKFFNRKLEISLWLHEPYKENKNEYGNKKYYFYITEYMQCLSYKYVDNFILHSKYALNLFNAHIKPRIIDRTFNSFVIPLQFRNIVNFSFKENRREYFTYTGNVAYAKGFDIFLEVARTNKTFKFQLITSSNIANNVLTVGNLAVIHKKILTDKEIAGSLCKSIATICLYRDSVQSGVIPFSFMCGTPILASNICALKEYLIDKYNCIIVNDINDLNEINEGMIFICKNFDILSKNCFDTFNQYFNDANFEKYYNWFIREKSNENSDS